MLRFPSRVMRSGIAKIEAEIDVWLSLFPQSPSALSLNKGEPWTPVPRLSLFLRRNSLLRVTLNQL